MRVTLLTSLLVVSACSAEGPLGVGDKVQELADPEPAFSIQSARFSNAIGGDPTTITYCGSSPLTACASTPFAQVRWGIPAFATAQSGLGFDPAAGHVVVYNETFDLGSLTHFNFPTYSGTWASDVTLDLHLRIDPSDLSAPIFDEEIHIPFKMNETPNDPEMACPYSPSLTPCSDKITFGTSTFNLGAATATTIYQLDIVGFVDPTSATPTDGLISEEYMSTSATLRAVLSETCVDADADEICDEVDACIGDEVACPPDPCPCDNEWNNHGEYVSCVAHHTTELVQAGELSHQQRAAIVSAAGKNSCGK
jgi:hypothetical protein